jgi:hypothetical protein
MGIGVGIFLIAIGAILAFAVDASVQGMDIEAVGVILMIAGAIGIVLDLVLWGPRRRTVVDGGSTVERRTVVDRDVY